MKGEARWILNGEAANREITFRVNPVKWCLVGDCGGEFGQRISKPVEYQGKLFNILNECGHEALCLDPDESSKAGVPKAVEFLCIGKRTLYGLLTAVGNRLPLVRETVLTDLFLI